MAAPSTYTWKNEAPWSDRICAVCKQPVVLTKTGVFTSSAHKFIRHHRCGPKVITFVSHGTEADLMAEAMIRDAEAARDR